MKSNEMLYKIAELYEKDDYKGYKGFMQSLSIDELEKLKYITNEARGLCEILISEKIIHHSRTVCAK